MKLEKRIKQRGVMELILALLLFALSSSIATPAQAPAAQAPPSRPGATTNRVAALEFKVSILSKQAAFLQQEIDVLSVDRSIGSNGSGANLKDLEDRLDRLERNVRDLNDEVDRVKKRHPQ